MSAYRFIRAADELAEAPWRPLDRALLRWTIAHGGSTELARVAAWASLAEGEGDTALPLAGAQAGRQRSLQGHSLLCPLSWAYPAQSPVLKGCIRVSTHCNADRRALGLGLSV
jgi:hypothetical protein